MASIEVRADMHCRSCEARMVETLESLPGVRCVGFDSVRQRVAVEFDDRVLDEAEIRKAAGSAGTHALIGP